MKKRIVILLFSSLLVACSTSDLKYAKVQGFAQGTTYSITYADSLGRDFSSGIDSLLAVFDKSLSNYDSLSLLSITNGGVDTVLDDWFVECFDVSQVVYHGTDSLFDPTLRPLIAAYGFGNMKEKGLRHLSQQQVDSIKQYVGFDKVTVKDNHLCKSDPRVTLDFNAIAQGYSVDVMAKWLESKGIRNYVVEIGGEVFARGVNAKGDPWRVGVDKPIEGNFTPGAELETIINLQDQGLATSGNYRKFLTDSTGEKLTHTIDPRSGRPARHNLLSVTVVAPTAALADGYATACMVGGLEWTRKFIARNSDVGAFVVYATENNEMKFEKLGKNISCNSDLQ